MTTFRPNSSCDHLLGPSAAPSIRSSRPASVFTEASCDTLLPTDSGHQGNDEPEGTYRGFPTHEAYLAALQEWVDSKLYFETDKQLRGWYGTKTKEEYLSKTSVWEERRARKQEEKRESERQRRATLARLGAVVEEERGIEEGDVGEEGRGAVKAGKKESRLRRVFGRRATVV